jgi:fucose permease
VAFLFFIFGFITTLNMSLVPHLRSIFDLSQGWAMLANTAFFLAYFVFASPTSKLIESIGYKRTMVISLFIQGVGCLLFVPVARDDDPFLGRSIWSHKHTVLGALPIFLYVGVEAGLTLIVVNYFKTQGIDSVRIASFLVSLYRSGALVGCLLGSWILTRVKSESCWASSALPPPRSSLSPWSPAARSPSRHWCCAVCSTPSCSRTSSRWALLDWGRRPARDLNSSCRRLSALR